MDLPLELSRELSTYQLQNIVHKKGMKSKGKGE